MPPSFPRLKLDIGLIENSTGSNTRRFIFRFILKNNVLIEKFHTFPPAELGLLKILQ